MRECPLNRVVLADDAVLIRDALARLLRQDGFEVLAEVGDADSLLAAVDTNPPSQHLESHCLTALLGADARGVGYLLKERVTGVAGFLDAVRRVADGGCVVDPEVVALMLRARRRDDRLATLTDREPDDHRRVLAVLTYLRAHGTHPEPR